MANFVCFLAARAARGAAGTSATQGVAATGRHGCASTPRPKRTRGSRRRPISSGLGTDVDPLDSDRRRSAHGRRRAAARDRRGRRRRRRAVHGRRHRRLGEHRRGRSAAARSPASAASTSSGSTSTARTAASRRRVPDAPDDLRGARDGRLGRGRSAQVAVRAARGRLRARARSGARCAPRSRTTRPTTTSTSAATNYVDYGPQNSRGFRALKVWLALRHVGRRRLPPDDRATTSRCRARWPTRSTRHPELRAADAGAEHHDVPLRAGRPARRASARRASSAYLDALNRGAARSAAARRRGVRLERRRRRPLRAARLHRELPHVTAGRRGAARDRRARRARHRSRSFVKSSTVNR